MHVLATSANGPDDPSFRIRLVLPGKALVSHGVDLEPLPLFSSEQARQFRAASAPIKAAVLGVARTRLRRELRTRAGDGGTVIIQRSVDMLPSLALERQAVSGKRLVYDIDDAVWLSGTQTAGHPLARFKGAARRVHWLARRADHIMAGNALLAEYLRDYNDAITIVPSLVDHETYPLRRHAQASHVTLGWIGSATTAGYLARIAGVLDKFASQSRRPVRLVVVGGKAPSLTGIEVQERPWNPAIERATLEEMDIGLMPLADTPWSRGKCAYKALQYMASGIPAVVDDVGISAEVVTGSGFVARDEAGWLEALHTLAEDPGLRAQQGGVGRQRIAAEFSFTSWIPKIARILRDE